MVGSKKEIIVLCNGQIANFSFQAEVGLSHFMLKYWAIVISRLSIVCLYLSEFELP